MSEFSHWLLKHGVPQDAIGLFLVLTEKQGVFQTPEKIMDPDSWFYFPRNTRFVLVGSCPNGDGIALDTVTKPGAMFFIDHERLHDTIPDSERSVCVADTLEQYVQRSLDDPKFPSDYHEAKRIA